MSLLQNYKQLFQSMEGIDAKNTDLLLAQRPFVLLAYVVQCCERTDQPASIYLTVKLFIPNG